MQTVYKYILAGAGSLSSWRLPPLLSEGSLWTGGGKQEWGALGSLYCDADGFGPLSLSLFHFSCVIVDARYLWVGCTILRQWLAIVPFTPPWGLLKGPYLLTASG
jgi:hypothetical protein